jgi:hypothetical protein
MATHMSLLGLYNPQRVLVQMNPPADNCQSIAWLITMITGMMSRFAVRPAGHEVQC